MRTITRASKMNQVLSLRCTIEDRAKLKLAAQRQGIDMSALVRQLLIKEGILDPL